MEGRTTTLLVVTLAVVCAVVWLPEPAAAQAPDQGPGDMGGVDGLITNTLGLDDLTSGAYNDDQRKKRLLTEKKRAELEAKRREAMYHQSSDLDYAVVVDLGSTQNQGYVFSWPERKAKAIAKVQFLDVKSVGETALTKPSVLDMDDPIDLLTPILDEAENLVPASRISRTLLFVRVTADTNGLDRGKVSALLGKIRSICGTYPFKFNWGWTNVLRPTENAAFDWLSANFIEENIQHEEDDKATIDLGHSYLMYAVAAPEERKPLTYDTKGFNMTLSGRNLEMYVGTWRDLGLVSSLDAIRYARAKAAVEGGAVAGAGNDSVVVEFPCYYEGYTDPELLDIGGTKVRLQGTALTGEQCFKDIETYIKLGELAPSDAKGSLAPPVLGSKTLYAMGEFYEVASGLNVAGMRSISDVLAAGIADCKHDWAFISQMAQPETDTTRLARRCFGSMYTYGVLHFGLQIPMAEKKVSFVNRLQETKTGWPHGLVTYFADLQPLPVSYETAKEGAGDVNWPVWIFLTCVMGIIAVIAVILVLVVDKMNKLSSASVQPVGFAPGQYDDGSAFNDDSKPLLYT